MWKIFSYFAVIYSILLNASVFAQGILPPPPDPIIQNDSAFSKSVLRKKSAVQKKTPLPVGWVEKITIEGAKHKVHAKLDTGAKTSSIDARIIKTFKKDNDSKEWVLYRVIMDDGKEETFENKIVRWVKIKTKNKDFVRRPVVSMRFCLGTMDIEGEVNLADRSHFIYPVLIGRNMLQKNVIVDVSKKYTISPKCKVKAQ